MSEHGRYILDEDGNPVACEDLMTWGQWMETADRRIARDELPDGHIVSTVFLGLDHSFGAGRPLLFETMVFNDYGETTMGCRRYATREEALEGHAEVVAELPDCCLGGYPPC